MGKSRSSSKGGDDAALASSGTAATAVGADHDSEVAAGGEAAPPVSRLYAYLCLVVSGVAWWPLALFLDGVRGTALEPLVHGRPRNGPNPQQDADGPEYVLGTPRRRLWLYNKGKRGHRGFLRTVLGAQVGGVLERVNAALWRGIPSAQRAGQRSLRDHSTDKDTLLLTGTVTDRATGEPVRGAQLSVWQADPRDAYAKYGDLDLDFDFRGRFAADPTTGAYAVGTLYPTTIGIWSASAGYLINALFWGVPGVLMLAYHRLTGRPTFDVRRPPHIHFYVSAPGYRTLVTQLYFPDRLADGELDEQEKTDPAHPNAAAPLSPTLLVHPSLVSAKAPASSSMTASGGLPRTKWALKFDFTLDRK